MTFTPVDKNCESGMNQLIRNFAIIAHIDHGKSTLADRLLELTHTVTNREMTAQHLDSNPIERERGITIKLAPVRMKYRSDGQDYILNLIDTPGHVDFSYEVSRSLAACEGAILVVDATQGIQAQTLANLHQAQRNQLVIIPVINKIDLPNARLEETKAELRSLGFQDQDMIGISAKTGENVEAVLEAVVGRIPPPQGRETDQLRSLIFSSQYDPHKGVVVFVRVVDGEIVFRPGLSLKFLNANADVNPIEIGYFTPKLQLSQKIENGAVGYIATGLKDIRYAKVGDTITTVVEPGKSETEGVIREAASQIEALPGYKEPKSMVFLGLFPVASDEIEEAREAMEKLRLSDSAFTFRPISSLALGNGFHCGFLGLLHAEVVQERLLREFGLTMIATAPSVEYQLLLKPGVNPGRYGLSEKQMEADEVEASKTKKAADDSQIFYSIQSAAEYPDPTVVETVKEPMMELSVFSPKRYVGAIMQLCQEKRGEYIDLSYIGDQAKFTYLMPLSEMIVDFFDRLKSATEGYASLDYEFFDYSPVDVVKVDILVNKEKVDAFSSLVVSEQAERRGREITERLAAVIPKQQFEVPVQAAIGGRVVARSDVKAFRKDVIAKLYGGDRTRKDKLLDKQKKGKAKMKMIGRVEIPQSAFFAVLKKE
jgi:GTP-binding protein LepA